MKGLRSGMRRTAWKWNKKRSPFDSQLAFVVAEYSYLGKLVSFDLPNLSRPHVRSLVLRFKGGPDTF